MKLLLAIELSKFVSKIYLFEMKFDNYSLICNEPLLLSSFKIAGTKEDIKYGGGGMRQ